MDHKQRLIAKESQRSGLRGRINAKCIECVYDDQAPGAWRQQVQACSGTSCPLYAVRANSTSVTTAAEG